jgi:hypothetical protein
MTFTSKEELRAVLYQYLHWKCAKQSDYDMENFDADFGESFEEALGSDIPQGGSAQWWVAEARTVTVQVGCTLALVYIANQVARWNWMHQDLWEIGEMLWQLGRDAIV